MMHMNERPLGITIIAVLLSLGAISNILTGIGLTAASGFMGKFFVNSEKIFIASGVILLAFGLIKGAAAIGLFLMKKWGWAITIALYGLSLTGSILSSLSDIFNVISVQINLAIIVYLYFKKSSFEENLPIVGSMQEDAQLQS